MFKSLDEVRQVYYIRDGEPDRLSQEQMMKALTKDYTTDPMVELIRAIRDRQNT